MAMRKMTMTYACDRCDQEVEFDREEMKREVMVSELERAGLFDLERAGWRIARLEMVVSAELSAHPKTIAKVILCSSCVNGLVLYLKL